MAEPLTASVAALSVGSFLWTTFGQGVAGNEAHRFYLLALDRWKNAPIDPATGLPTNHDLLMASRDALREATLVLIFELAGRLDPKKPWIPAILDHVRQGKLGKVPLIEARQDPHRQWIEHFRELVQSTAFPNEVHDQLLLTENDVRACFAEGCDLTFNKHVGEHLAKWAAVQVNNGARPDDFDKALADGWQTHAGGPRMNLGQTYCLFFREHLKRRPEVFRIYVADLLGDILAKLNAPAGTSAPTIDAFDKWMEPRLASVVDLLGGLDTYAKSLAVGQTGILAKEGEILAAVTTLAIEVKRNSDAAKFSLEELLPAVLNTEAGVELLIDDAALKNETLAEIKTLVASNRPPILASPVSEQAYLHQLKASILGASPPWDPALYTELHAAVRSSPNAAFWIRSSKAGVNDLLARAKNHKYPLVITGAPGSGKSVVLRQLALTLADEALNDHARPLPVLVDLKHYRDDVPAIDFLKWNLVDTVKYAAGIGSKLETLLGQGRLVLLLDAMDEMRTRKREYEKRVFHLQELIQHYPANRFIFTCRERDFDRSLAVEEWAIRELNDEQMEELIAKSYERNKQPYPHGLRPVVMREERPDLWDACRKPWVLRMLLTYYESKSCLPQHLRELYEEFVSHLIAKHELGRPVVEDCRRVLARIALMLTNSEGLGDPVTLDDICNSNILQTKNEKLAYKVALEGGILDDEGNSIVFRYHRLQEYFSALALDEKCRHDESILEDYLDDIWAEEIISTLVAVSKSPDSIVQILLDRNLSDSYWRPDSGPLLIAAHSIATAGVTIAPDLRSQVAAQLEKLTKESNLVERVKALRALTKLSPERAIPLLREQRDKEISPMVQDTVTSCLREIDRIAPQLKVKASARDWTRSVPTFLRQSPEVWGPMSNMLLGLWGFSAIALLGSILAGWMGWIDGLAWPSANVLYVIAYILAFYLWDRLTYEWRIGRKARFNLLFAIRWGAYFVILLLVLAIGLVLLRPYPFGFLAFASVVSVCVALRFVFRVPDNAKPGINAVASLLQFVPALGFAFLHVVLGLTADDEVEGLFTAVSPIFALMLAITVITAMGIDALTLRWLAAKRRTVTLSPPARRGILAFASTPSQSNIVAFNWLTGSVRRQAIRILGHLPYEQDSFEALFTIAENDDYPLAQDAACQAIDEIQQRQRRAGRSEGLDLSPQYDGSREMGVGSVIMLFVIIGSIVLVSYGGLSAHRLIAGFTSRYHFQGFVLSRLYQERAAVATYEQGLRSDPASPALLNNLSWLHLSSSDPSIKDPAAAVRYAKQAVQSDGEQNWASLHTLAEAHYQAGDRDRSLEALDKAIKLAPKNQYLKSRRKKIGGT